jgi:hypothetical protein
MNLIQSCTLPEGAMLSRYAQNGAYTDCYFMDMPMSIGLSEYIKSIYTTPLFKIERSILALIARRPSTDLGAEELANNKTTQFAAWSVEDRGANQMLLCDFMGRTRSWLMAEPHVASESKGTRLYFGSAVVPKSVSRAGVASYGFAFHALYGLHHIYTKALMQAAQSKLLHEKI